MKILMVNDTLQKFGGAEIYIFNLAELLRKSGHTVEYFGSKQFENPLSIVTRIYDPLKYREISQRIREFKPDIIHCHNISRTISPSILHAAKRNNIPVVMTVHDFHMICPKTWFIYEDGEPCKYGFGRRCLFSNCHTFHMGKKYAGYHLLKFFKIWLHRRIIKNNVSIFLAPSESLAKWLYTGLGVKAIFLPNFIQTVHDDFPVKDNKRLLFVGRLSKEKGVANLIHSMEEILKEIPEASLTIIGEGPEKQKLKEMANPFGNRINFEGRVEDKKLSKYYQDTELVVIPSIWAENCPLVALEAFSYGRPVIASNLFGLSDMINNNVGAVFEGKDYRNLSKVCVNLLNDFNLLQKMAESARAAVNTTYSAEHHLSALTDAYIAALRSRDHRKENT